MTMLPIFLAAAKQLNVSHGPLVFLLPLAPTVSENLLYENGLSGCTLDIRIIKDDRYDLMAACDVVVAASGTVTLELNILEVPMVVAYRFSPLTYFLGHRFIKVPYAALTNLVADRMVVPELLQHDATPAAISRELARILTDNQARNAMLADLKKVKFGLGKSGAARRAAILGMTLYERGIQDSEVG